MAEVPDRNSIDDKSNAVGFSHDENSGDGNGKRHIDDTEVCRGSLTVKSQDGVGRSKNLAVVNAVSEGDELVRLRREREEEMERLLMEQDEEVDFLSTPASSDNNNGEDTNIDQMNNNNNALRQQGDELGGENMNNEMMLHNDDVQAGQQNLVVERNNPGFAGAGAGGTNNTNYNNIAKRGLLSYRQASFGVMVGLIYYAFRTRRQYYLAVVYLSSSKWAFVVFGNATIAFALSVFDIAVSFFLDGLRIQEAEGLNDFFRWNVTETCLALTMFRSELTVSTALDFVALVTIKCLHHVTAMREKHLRMTQEAVVESPTSGYPTIRGNHLRLLLFLLFLQFLDLTVLQYTVSSILQIGASVKILFAFEAAILLVSSWSHILLWHLHCVDSLLIYGHEQRAERIQNGHTRHSIFLNVCYRALHPWKEYKATLQFAIQLQAQAIQFLFYITFFSIVLTFYGMPINLFREVYMSFIALKERLTAFLKYRQLMACMNRFDNVANDNALEEAGRICIICRDEMTLNDCKRLPMCNHVFHKSCLREWLVQQQTCPTCRSDIAANEAQERTRRAAAQAAENRETTTVETVSDEAGAGAAVSNVVDPVESSIGTAEALHQQRPNINNESNDNASTSGAAIDGLEPQTNDPVPIHDNTPNLVNAPTISAEVLPTTVTSSASLEQVTSSASNIAATTMTIEHEMQPISLNQKEQRSNTSAASIAGSSYQPGTHIIGQQHTYESVKKSVRFLEQLQEQRTNIAAISQSIQSSSVTVNNNYNNYDDNTRSTMILMSSFPALYKVIQEDGATVHNDCSDCDYFSDNEVASRTSSAIIRTIPCGTLVLGQGLATAYPPVENSIGEDGTCSKGCTFVKIPDGWVHEHCVSREAIIRTRKTKCSNTNTPF